MKFNTVVERDAPIVAVDWIDSQQDGGGWRDFNSNWIMENQMRSVGWMIEQDAEKTVIVPHVGLNMSGSPDQMMGRIVIPTEQIKRIVRLVEYKKETDL